MLLARHVLMHAALHTLCVNQRGQLATQAAYCTVHLLKLYAAQRGCLVYMA